MLSKFFRACVMRPHILWLRMRALALHQRGRLALWNCERAAMHFDYDAKKYWIESWLNAIRRAQQCEDYADALRHELKCKRELAR